MKIFKGAAFLGFVVTAIFAVKLLFSMIPDEIYLNAGEEASYDFGVPVTVSEKESNVETFAGMQMSYTVSCSLFGVVPLKEISVNVVGTETLYACGEPVGIYARSDGILVVSVGRDTPSYNLLKTGDYIVSIDGVYVGEKEIFKTLVNECGKDKVTIGLKRGGEYIEVSVAPQMSDDGSYILGVWVRDDLAGVGTMTYYREDGSFGALGHPISDSDTGGLFELSEGSLYTTDIIGISRGERGNPGELSGIIDYAAENYLGEITDNTASGIHGVLTEEAVNMMEAESYPVGYKQDIHTGSAYILSAASGARKLYEIEIEGIDYNSKEINKGIIFTVTDEELINLTGGVVRGMSGSALIQDGRIIGAVTHVLVNDSTKGYGIFIERMLD
jgi:stage IV sporulation protein B